MNKRISNKISKKIVATMLVAAMGFSLTACGDDVEENKVSKTNNLTQNVEAIEVESKEIDEDFIYATADFSVNIFKESAIEDISNGENVLLSPQSIITAMSMTTNGASGNTLKELQDAMCGGMSIEEYNKYMKNYSGRLTSDKDVDFYLANSIWFKDNESLDVKDDFLQTCKSYYNASVYKEPFDASTTDKINGWVQDNTNQMIDSIIKEIPKDAVMYLVNATAFEGEWQNEYNEYQVKEDVPFTNSKGEEEMVVMLSSTEGEFLKDDMATGFVKYYKGGNYAFVAMLPNENIALEDYVSSMTGDKLIATYNGREAVDVVVRMPEFTYEYERELSDDFKNLGVTDAFDGGKADLTGIGSSDEGNLAISRVIHKTYIELDRNGTKAAAVTAVEVRAEGCAEPSRVETVILDRPFYYAIIDCETGLPVFMGAVNSVN